jgi:hypothetical protein
MFPINDRVIIGRAGLAAESNFWVAKSNFLVATQLLVAVHKMHCSTTILSFFFEMDSK